MIGPIDPRSLARTLRDPKRNIGWWVDDVGSFRAYRVIANDAREAIDESDPFPEGRTGDLAIFRMGMVRVERLRRGVRLDWDVQRVEKPALASVRAALLAGDLGDTVALNFHYGAWAREFYEDAASAADRIMELDRFRDAPPTGMIASAEHTVADLVKAKPLLREAHARWAKAEEGRLEDFDGPFRPMSRFSLVFSESAAAGGFQYRSVGRQAHIVSYLGRDWARDVIGKPSILGHADIEFETVVSEPYFETLHSGKPHYGHVRAVFEIAGRDPEWVSYQRLILPYLAANGARALAIMVAPDQDVSIPFPVEA